MPMSSRDLSHYYGYSEYMMEKLMDLFPLSEVPDFSDYVLSRSTFILLCVVFFSAHLC